MELNEREAHCVARLIQGAMFGRNVADGCQFCRFKCGATCGSQRAADLRKRLTKVTGVDLTDRLPESEFPHDRFIKGANEEIKDYYRKEFGRLIALCDI